jgi:hypothetical protein
VVDAAAAVEPGLVSAEAPVKGSEREKDPADEQPTIDAFALATVPGAENSPAEIAFGRDTRARDVVVVPCRSESVSHDTVCGLLMRQLQDVSAFVLVFFGGSFVDNCVYDSHFSSEQALSFTKVAENIIME